MATASSYRRRRQRAQAYPVICVDQLAAHGQMHALAKLVLQHHAADEGARGTAAMRSDLVNHLARLVKLVR